jgi:ribosomal protein S18 acetylase RimI-like enzyme
MAQSMPDRPPSLLMRRDLREPIEPAVWPQGIRLQAFTTEDAVAVHSLLAAAYVDGSGSVPAFAAWWSSLANDAEFDPKLVFVAWDRGLGIVGVAQCWTGAHIKDLAVDRDWRRRGLGRALLLHTFQVFKDRNALGVTLKVHADNPSGAIRLYRAVGMRQVSR